jgi:sulfate adenylyltransferase
VTAGAEAARSADRSDLPACTLTYSQLGDLELLLSGALAPLTGFMTDADAASVLASGRLADGTPFPIPVTLDVPAAALPGEAELAAAGRLLLADPEGAPVAVLRVTEFTPLGAAGPPAGGQASRWPATAGPWAAQPGAAPDVLSRWPDTADGAARPGQAGPLRAAAESLRAGQADLAWAGSADALRPGSGDRYQGRDLVRLAGPVSANRPLEHGPFRRLMLTPAATRARLGDGPVLGYATRGPLNSRQIGQLRHLAGQLRAQVLVLPLVSGPAEVVNSPQALIRTVLAAAPSLPAGTQVVPVPLAPRAEAADGGKARELAARAWVAAAYGATHLMADDSGQGLDADVLASVPIPIVPSGDWAYDPHAEVWRPLALIDAGYEQEDLSADQLGDLLDAGSEIPAWFTPAAVARELRRVRRPRSQRGLVLFLTGLSGSGKSTIARDLSDVLAERGDRQVSLLDGDLVRQLLSAGLTFSRADRDLNIARIGYVAAEIARHGGIAICAPIAPFAEARAQVRRMVSEVGDFFLIHVATPVEVCEARDRKGLYAKARAGIIRQFTGISDPYEEPADAELVIDTSVASREEAVEAVLKLLTTGGWLGDDGP